VRAIVVVILCFVAACSHVVPSSGAQTENSAAKRERQIDKLCMQDCVGSQAGEEFCKDRCSF
jgi:hypothetical protein